MIDKIRIKNYKVLKDIELSLSNLTIIAGLNCMGKSSLIQVLLLLRQSFEKSNYKSGLLLNGAYINIGTGKDAFSINAEKGEDFSFMLEWENNDFLLTEFEYKSHSNLQPMKKRKSSKNFKFTKALFSTKFQYLAAERVGPQNTFPVSDFDVNSLHSLGNNGEYTANYLAVNGLKEIFIKELIHIDAKSNTLLAQVDSWMSEITPGVKISANIIIEINQASLQYEFETQSGYTEKFRPKNVGFGLTYALPIVTAILSSSPGDLLIIENPEAHLHPAGQSAVAKLVSLASQNGVQIIIETHSDHFLNGIRVAVKEKNIAFENVSIFYFSRKPGSEEHSITITEPFIGEDGNLDEWPKGFFDEWEKNLDKLLE